jgi:hypothetical protein
MPQMNWESRAAVYYPARGDAHTLTTGAAADGSQALCLRCRCAGSARVLADQTASPDLPEELALNSERDHNHSMKTGSRLSRLFGWSVRCVSVVLALAFCASAFAADPSKNVVLPAQPQRVTKTAKKMCYTLTSTSGIPEPCDRLSAIPTTASPVIIYGNRLGTAK